MIKISIIKISIRVLIGNACKPDGLFRRMNSIRAYPKDLDEDIDVLEIFLL